MLLQCLVRSVGKQTSYQVDAMIQILRDTPVTAVSRRYSSTMDERDMTSSTGSQKTVDEEYEESIKALNTLQSNADTIRRSIENKARSSQVEDTKKYLQRSGLGVEDLKRLSFIHVSGTKGKGSTCALTESILRSHGIKTGFFSSPHLVSVTERIRLDGQPISKSKFTQAFWRILNRLKKSREHACDLPPYFQFLTILSFHIFLEEKVDVVVLEVGIGGELDSTNVISHTKTVGISSLGLEHTQLLGNTLEEIAWQKAGIIKNNSNVYTTVKQPECLSVIRERAAGRNAKLYIVPEFSQYMLDEECRAVLQNSNNIVRLNGSLSIQLAYDWLRNNLDGYSASSTPNTVQITPAVIKGLTSCSWPGRCEIRHLDNFKIHLDGAHTVDSLWVCSSWFEKATAYSGNPKVLLFNVTGDRDSRKLLDILRQRSHFVLACFVPNIAAGDVSSADSMSVFGISTQLQRVKMNASNWQALCQESAELDSGKVFGSILDAFNFVRQRFGSAQDVDLLVTGSLHLIGATVQAMEEFKRRLDLERKL